MKLEKVHYCRVNRYQILVEYDGSNFVGWQYQKNGASIQKTIQIALSKLLKEKVILYGAGRTDAGVHAIEQSAHFDCKKSIPNISKLIMSLNFFLNKKKISVKNIKKKNKNFHARYSAKKRIYKYMIRNGLSQSVINFNKEWHIIKNLDYKLLKKGAKKLLGTHDFSTFRASNCNAKSPIKQIEEIKISKNKNLIIITFISKSFLKSQVRSMVGCLKYLSEDKWSLNKFEMALKSKKRHRCAPLAPPHGLYLTKVIY